MRHVYSIVRFVPDPTRGEFVNIGIVAGSEDTGEWLLRTVSDFRRASRLDDAGLLPRVSSRLVALQATLDQVSEANAGRRIAHSLPVVNEEWLAQVSSVHLNTLQFTPPLPAVGETAEEVVDLLWDEFILEAEGQERAGLTKLRAVGHMTKALRSRVGSEHFWRRPVLGTNSSHARVDFAVHNGKVVHLTQCWSFQIKSLETLLEEIKAWAWTIRDLRSGGGGIEPEASEAAKLEVARRIPITAVIIPPKMDNDLQAREGGEALREARAAFRDHRVQADEVDFERANVVAERAAELLAKTR